MKLFTSNTLVPRLNLGAGHDQNPPKLRVPPGAIILVNGRSHLSCWPSHNLRP